VGGILREPKSMRLEAPWSIFYKATIFDTFLIRDSDCPLKRLFGVRAPRVFGGNVYSSAVTLFLRDREHPLGLASRPYRASIPTRVGQICVRWPKIVGKGLFIKDHAPICVTWT
jgi:hypothetical protein